MDLNPRLQGLQKGERAKKTIGRDRREITAAKHESNFPVETQAGSRRIVENEPERVGSGMSAGTEAHV